MIAASMTSTPGKKRKREPNGSAPTSDTPMLHTSIPTPREIRLLATENTDLIPIVGSFSPRHVKTLSNQHSLWRWTDSSTAATPGVQIPPDTKLAAYSRPRPTKRSKPKPGYAVEYIVHGTTGRIDYEGRELEEVEKHYVGIYDPVTGDVEMYPAPRVLLRREIRSLREKSAELAKRNTSSEFVSAVSLFGKFFSARSDCTGTVCGSRYAW